MGIIKRTGDWKQLVAEFQLATADIVDLHFGPRDLSQSYYEVMADVEMKWSVKLVRLQVF
jgi:hypothetical protein